MPHSHNMFGLNLHYNGTYGYYMCKVGAKARLYFLEACC